LPIHALFVKIRTRTPRQTSAMVHNWRILAFFASCIFSEPRAAHFRPAF